MAKRAAFICSNTECRVSTVGPNAESDKATIIGEAAHICGARAGSARYDSEMSDVARAEITNAIWLCRNCHKKIDRNPKNFSAELLFTWREEHERFVAENLGSANDSIQADIEEIHLDQFRGYPPVVKRIAIDKPDGWEWRLSAELMRYLNRPMFRKLNDLSTNLYTVQVEQVDDEDAFDWISIRLDDMANLVTPLSNLLSQLNDAWGQPGEPGDVVEIHHVCCLIRDALEKIVAHEERLRFVRISDDFHPILALIKDNIGEQSKKLSTIPDDLDKIVGLLGTEHGGTTEAPHMIEMTITFELPDGWSKKFNRELRRLKKTLDIEESNGGNWRSFFGLIIIIFILYAVFA